MFGTLNASTWLPRCSRCRPSICAYRLRNADDVDQWHLLQPSRSRWSECPLGRCLAITPDVPSQYVWKAAWMSSEGAVGGSQGQYCCHPRTTGKHGALNAHLTGQGGHLVEALPAAVGEDQ
jgi:hypothetical protein